MTNIYSGYYYMMTEAAQEKFNEMVDVVLDGHYEYPCGTKVPVRYHDRVPEWQRVFREEVEMHGVKIDLYRMQDIYGNSYDMCIQHTADDPRGNGSLLVFVYFMMANGKVPPKLRWTDEAVLHELEAKK